MASSSICGDQLLKKVTRSSTFGRAYILVTSNAVLTSSASYTSTAEPKNS
ncbi:15565_t:CDS:2 [Gigaspora rosea]|nr:15565_t:CDS:2 [Gigaspora rosea]